MNGIFLAIVSIAFLVGAFTGGMEAVSVSAFDGAKKSVELAISLIGYMALFLGLMKVAEEGGLAAKKMSAATTTRSNGLSSRRPTCA